MIFETTNTNKSKIFFKKKETGPEEFYDEPEPEIEEAEDDSNIIYQWQAPEFEKYERSRRWYLIASLLLAAIIGYAVISNNPVMAITFVLIGVVGYIFLNKEPRILTFTITHDGIAVDKDLYEFDNIDSFWIFYEPPAIKALSIKTRGKLTPYVHLPIHREDPTEIREILLKYIPEEKQELTMVDTIERILHI